MSPTSDAVRRRRLATRGDGGGVASRTRRAPTSPVRWGFRTTRALAFASEAGRHASAKATVVLTFPWQNLASWFFFPQHVQRSAARRSRIISGETPSQASAYVAYFCEGFDTRVDSSFFGARRSVAFAAFSPLGTWEELPPLLLTASFVVEVALKVGADVFPRSLSVCSVSS